MLKDEDARCILANMSNASCSLDAQPTWLLKKIIDCNVPLLTKIVNSSLQSGVFPDIACQAIVTPIIKEQGLHSENLQNYWPVSNLSHVHVAKVIEKAAASQLTEHLNHNDLNDPLQSAYRSDFSTETALLKLQNDVIMYFDQGKCVFLVLLDLSELRLIPLTIPCWLKVLGKSVGLCKTSKRKDQLYISLLVSVWRISYETFNPNRLILAEIWMKM